MELNENEQKTIALCQEFANSPFPFPNANLMSLVARLANALEAVEDEKEEAYLDRNYLAVLAETLARKLGLNTGYAYDKTTPGYLVLYIDLPEGQISYHLPRNFLEENVRTIRRYEPYRLGPVWDGHSKFEKRRRIQEYVRNNVAKNDFR